MIPKIIHYCWFGGAEKSPLIRRCIETWQKVMPDYQIKEWNETNFDLNSVPFVREAHAARKWAFMADYVRLYALYNEGGIYLDTDVKVMRPFDEFLDYSFFSCQESHPDLLTEGSILPDGTRNPMFNYVLGIGLCSAVMGAEKGCPYLKDCLDFYSTLHFEVEHKNDYVIVNLIAKVLEKYGYRYVLNEEQHLTGNICIMKPYVFAGMLTLTDESYALHLYNGSWVDTNKGFKHKLRNQFPTLYSWIQQKYYRSTGKYKPKSAIKKVLIVSTHPTHPTNAGNRVAILAQRQILAELGYEVHFLYAITSLKDHKEEQEMVRFWGENYHEFRLNWFFRSKRFITDYYRKYLCNGYWKVDDHYPTGLARAVNKLDEKEHFEAVIVQYMRLSKLLTSIQIPRKAIYTHDVFSYKDIRVGAPFYETCTAAEEAKAMQRSPFILAIQDKEADYFRFLSPHSKVYTVYSPYIFHEQPIAKTQNVLFVASRMDFNVSGIQWVLDHVWSKVVEQIPNAKLLIAGSVCENISTNLPPNVVVCGPVNSLDDFYAQGNVVINPVFLGTGLKIKTFEAISYGKVTIVHPHSQIGIYDVDHAPIIPVITGEEWVLAIVRALSPDYDYHAATLQDKEYIERMNNYIKSQFIDFLK